MIFDAEAKALLDLEIEICVDGFRSKIVRHRSARIDLRSPAPSKVLESRHSAEDVVGIFSYEFNDCWTRGLVQFPKASGANILQIPLLSWWIRATDSVSLTLHTITSCKSLLPVDGAPKNH